MTDTTEGIVLSVLFSVILVGVLCALLVAAGREDRAVDEAEAARREELSEQADLLIRRVHAAKVELRKRGHNFGWFALMHPHDIEAMTASFTQVMPAHKPANPIRIWGMDVMPSSHVPRGKVLLMNDLTSDHLTYDGETLR